VAEIIAFEQQGLAGGAGQGIGEAIAEIQPRRMATAPAVITVCLAGYLRLRLADRLASASLRRIATRAELSTITRQPALVVEQITVIGGAVRLFEPGGAIAPDCEEPLGKAMLVRPADTLDPFAKRFGDGDGHALAGQRCELAGESVRGFAFDVQAHLSTSIG
jgi:hypothetical protein